VQDIAQIVDEAAAEAVGINAYWHKMLAFTTSGFFQGVGGGLLAHLITTISPTVPSGNTNPENETVFILGFFQMETSCQPLSVLQRVAEQVIIDSCLALSFKLGKLDDMNCCSFTLQVLTNMQ
jgi:hypothetical protein